jgi:hypothetical protein
MRRLIFPLLAIASGIAGFMHQKYTEGLLAQEIRDTSRHYSERILERQQLEREKSYLIAAQIATYVLCAAVFFIAGYYVCAAIS